MAQKLHHFSTAYDLFHYCLGFVSGPWSGAAQLVGKEAIHAHSFFTLGILLQRKAMR